MKKWLLTSLLLLSGQSLADCSGVHCTNVKITRLVITESGISVGTSGDEKKLDCDAGTYDYLKLELGHKNYDSIYSLILTSHTTEHPIWLRVSDKGSCKISYVVSDK